MSASRTASLFRNGRNQAVRIPVEFELPGTEVYIRKEGDNLVIAPKQPQGSLLEYLRAQEPLGLDDEFPDIDDHLPMREIDL